MSNPPPSIPLKRKKVALYLFLSFSVGLILGGTIVGTSFYHHFFNEKPWKKGHQKRPHHSLRLFKHIDKKPQDGVLRLEEIVTFGEKLFIRLDDNDDGYISPSEAPNRPPKHWQKEFLEIFKPGEQTSKKKFLSSIQNLFNNNDINQDKQITPREMQQSFKNRLFSKIDTNQDGVLSKEEFLNHRPRFRRKRSK
jgi:hypothetical protein